MLFLFPALIKSELKRHNVNMATEGKALQAVSVSSRRVRAAAMLGGAGSSEELSCLILCRDIYIHSQDEHKPQHEPSLINKLCRVDRNDSKTDFIEIKIKLFIFLLCFSDVS